MAAEAPKPKKLQKLAPPPQAQERVPVGGALAEPGKKKKKKKAGKGAAPAAKPAAAGFSIQVADGTCSASTSTHRFPLNHLIAGLNCHRLSTMTPSHLTHLIRLASAPSQ